MSRKNSDVFSEVVVGIFMVAVIALLGYFTIIISGVDMVFGRTRAQAMISFKDVGGLKERDNVVYRGMKVGSVEKITLGPSNILVQVSVDDDVVLRKSYRVSVSALSLLGGNYLLLEEGTGEPLPLATTVFHGEPPVDWMRDLGAIARNLNDLTSGGNIRSIVTNFEATAANLNAIVARVERGEGTVGKLLSSDETVYNDLSNTVASAKSAAANIDTIAARVERGEGTVGKLLSTNDVVHADIRSALASAKEALDTVKSAAANIDKISARVGGREHRQDLRARGTRRGVDRSAAVHERHRVRGPQGGAREHPQGDGRLQGGRGSCGTPRLRQETRRGRRRASGEP